METVTNLAKLNRSLSEQDDPAFDSETTRQELHYNYLQLLSYTVSAQYLYGVAGRGTGKSEGVLALRLHRLLTVMPRSSIVAIGKTYIQLLSNTLPALFKGMHRLGYRRDVNYWVGRLPDRKLNLELPYNTPMNPQYTIFMQNPGKRSVSALRLVGQDRPGSANGLSVNALIGDEVRLLNKPKLDNEVLAINRGDEHLFGGLSEHHSIAFTTDMPMRGEADWLKDAKEDALLPHHQEAVRLILAIQLELYKERQALTTSRRNNARLKRIATYENKLNELRRGLVHYAAASSFANVHALGLEYFKKLYREMRPNVFRARILNEEADSENLYYPDLNREKHCYNAVDYKRIDTRDFEKLSWDDCRKDADIDHRQPLVLTGDYGSSFNCLHVAQRISRLNPINRTGFDEVRHLKSFGLLSPAKIQHVVTLFTEYYQYLLRKEVTYVYDPTAVGTDGKSTMTYADEVEKALKAAGWKVNRKYIKKVPSHHARYLGWGVALSEADERFARQRFNEDNTKKSFTCMQQAKTRQGTNGFEKDKRDEKNPDIPQDETTHFTDAIDTAFWYLTFIEPGRMDLLPVVMGS